MVEGPSNSILSGGPSCHNSNCKVVSISGKRPTRQRVDYIPSKEIRQSVIRQLRLKTAPRTIAIRMQLTEGAVWSVIHDGMFGDGKAA